MRRWTRVLLGAGALVLAAGQCGVGGEAELACLDAVAHLDACCPALDATLFACGEGGEAEAGCAVVVRSSTIPLDESRCICARPCAELVARGVCARAQRLAGAAPDRFGDAPLCP